MYSDNFSGAEFFEKSEIPTKFQICGAPSFEETNRKTNKTYEVLDLLSTGKGRESKEKEWARVAC